MARLPSTFFLSSAAWVLCSLSCLASASLHHFFIGNGDAPASVYSLAYDDQAASLEVVKNNSVRDIHPFLTFNHNQKNLYSSGSGSRKFYSYTVSDATTLTYDTSLEVTNPCANTSASHLLASPNWPYTVFGTHYPGPASCGTVLNIFSDDSGVLTSVASNYSYGSDSAVYGLAFSPNAYFLYSADVDGGAVWMHYVNPTNGNLIERSRTEVPGGGGPSEVLVHRMGLVLYVLLRETNEVVVFGLDRNSAVPVATGQKWALLPSGADQNNYISTGLSLSSDGKYLWTTSSSKYYDEEGYVNVFSIDKTSGQVLKKLATEATSLGSNSHAASTAPFASDLMALSYYPSGDVEIWQVVPTADGSSASLKVVTGTQIEDGGCCGKALWYD